MASILIRNLSDETKAKLRVRAAQHGRSLEAEARIALDQMVKDKPVIKAKGKGDWVDELRARLMAITGGVDIEMVLPPRQPMQPPIDYDGPESGK